MRKPTLIFKFITHYLWQMIQKTSEFVWARSFKLRNCFLDTLRSLIDGGCRIAGVDGKNIKNSSREGGEGVGIVGGWKKFRILRASGGF